MPINLLDKPILMYDRIFKAVVVDPTDTRLKVRKTSERVNLIVETDTKEHILVELNSNYDKMLNSNIEEIKKLGKRDKIIRKCEDKMLTITKSGVVLNHLSDKEEEEKMLRSRILEAKDEEKTNIAINMLKDKMPIDVIMKYTSLTKEEIEKLQNNLK